MNIEALESMESFAEQVLSLSSKHQEEFFENLRDSCLTEEEINSLKKSVSLYRMFTEPSFFKEMQQATMECYLANVN
jgi:uncharacterized protein YerC